MSVQDIVSCNPEFREKMVADFKPSKMRGLLASIGSIHAKVNEERNLITKRQQTLEDTIEKQVYSHKVVQKALGGQISAANRGYSTLLTEHQGLRSLADELRDQLDKQRQCHLDEVKQLEMTYRLEKMATQTKMGELERLIGGIEVERDTLKSSVSWYEKEVVDIARVFEGKVDVSEKAYHKICDEVKEKTALIEKEKEIAADAVKALKAEIVKKKTEIRHQKEDMEKLQLEINSQSTDIEKLVGEVEELKKNKGKVVDHTALIDEATALKEEGYLKLCQDFTIMQNKNHEEMAKMREQYEVIVKNLEAEARNMAQKHKMKCLFLEQQLLIKEDEVKDVRDCLHALRDKVEQDEAQLQKEWAITKRELDVAKQVLHRIGEEEKAEKKVVSEQADTSKTKDRRDRNKAVRLEKEMENLTRETQLALAAKDEEIQELMQQSAKLQNQIIRDSEKVADGEKKWEERFQAIERVVEETREEVRAAEDQIEREKQSAVSLKEEIHGKQAQFVALDIAYRKQIAARLFVEERLKEEKVELQKQIEVEIEKQVELRCYYEKQLEEKEKEKAQMREDYEFEISELKEMVAHKDAAFRKSSEECIALREEMDENERKADTKIKDLSRQIQALKAEMNFALEMAEEKFQRLQQEYDRLKNKYDMEMADGNVTEMKDKVADLRRELMEMNQKMQELNDVISKLHVKIRERDFEINETRRETADLLFKKETAYREMCAQVPPLEKRIEEEIKKREVELEVKDQEIKLLHKSFGRKLKEKDKIIESLQFNDRDDLLEQIVTWKRKFCEEKDRIPPIEMHYTRLIEKQQEAAKVVTNENGDLRRELETAQKAIPELRAQYEQKISSLNCKYDTDIGRKDEAIVFVKQEIERLKAEFASQLEAETKEPEYVQEYRDKIASQAQEIEIATEGRKIIVQENLELKNQFHDLKIQSAQREEESSKRLVLAERKIERMDSKYADFKKLMCEELVQAENQCREMEKQLQNLPNPFIDEVVELRENMKKMSIMFEAAQKESAHLTDEMAEQRRKAGSEKQELEEKVALASMVINEVEQLKSLKSLAEMERFLEVDLDGDGKIG